MIGVGSFGNLAGAAPLAFTADLFGWRSTMLALGSVSAAISVGLFLFVKNPKISKNINKGSFLDLLKIKNLWFIFPLVLIHYAPVAGIRGLWIGPYINDTLGERWQLSICYNSNEFIDDCWYFRLWSDGSDFWN